MKLLKKLIIAILVIVAFLFMTCEPTEPQGNMTPYMSDVAVIPRKIYAKGKPRRAKKTKVLAYKSLGKFTLTAYCGCTSCSGSYGNKTATGTEAKANHTIAVDPKVISYGSKIKIGNTVYTAEDCGGGIKGKHIDIYFTSHSKALKFGKKKKVVYIRI